LNKVFQMFIIISHFCVSHFLYFII
jgi:hypothetical protein